MNKPLNKIPKHVAIIMDGNVRWATKQGLPRREGHLAGVEAVRKVLNRSLEIGVSTLSLFTLSSENLNRPASEVETLLEIYMNVIESDSDKLHEEGIKVEFIGDHSVFSENLQLSMAKLMKITSKNTRMNLIIAMNYSGRWDIMQATQKIANSIQLGDFKSSEISIDLLNKHIVTTAYSEPDLLIRTSGEYRISNFYLWQLAYTELYFTEVFWPDFDEAELDKALHSFSSRVRRFGLRHE